MLQIYPLKFKPILKPVMWGGAKIGRLKKLPGVLDNIGESWELSGVPGHESVVCNGVYAGKNIKSLLQEFGKELMGQSLFHKFGNQFPLLVKFIDAAKDLSIQVHPGDELADRLHGCMGKTELWYVLHADEGAVLYCGFAHKTDKDDFRRQIESSNVVSQLNVFNPQKGDVFYLPAGRVHGIGGGNFIAEIQQSSDITYRIYDFDRLDKDGKRRELHTDLALDAIDFDEYKDYKNHLELSAHGQALIKKCEKFSASLMLLEEPQRIEVRSTGSFRILICISGTACLTDNNGNETALETCETVLLPYAMEDILVSPVGAMPLELISVVVE